MSTGSSASSASSQESSVEALLEERAQQLFLVGDQERKGFIVKRDMQRMRSEIPMSPEQLEAVFESLDVDHNGYLTIEQFLSGFGTFVRSETELSCGGSEARNLLRQIDATNLLHSCMDILRQLCEIIQLSANMPLLEQFLRQLLEDLVRIQDEQHALEEVLRTKDEEHESRVQGLFEEMEAQLSEEKEKQILQNEQIIWQRTKTLENQLAEKEQNLQDALRTQQDLSNRLHTLRLQSREENERFLQAKEEAEVQLELERQEMSQRIKKWQQERENERLSSLAKGFQLGKRVTTEHHGLLKQLQLLQEMASVLEGRNEDDVLHKNCHVDKCHWQKYPENVWTDSLARMESDDFFQEPSHTHT